MKDNLYGENMGKYKLFSPQDVATTAWQKLKEASPRMKRNYEQAITEAIDMDGGRNRYIAGVSLWVDTMRLPEIRNAIGRAVQEAKQKYRQRLLPTGVPRKAVAVPTP